MNKTAKKLKLVGQIMWILILVCLVFMIQLLAWVPVGVFHSGLLDEVKVLALLEAFVSLLILIISRWKRNMMLFLSAINVYVMYMMLLKILQEF